MRLLKSEEIPIKHGFCYLVDMNPPRKSKPGKIRPIIVIQATDIIEVGAPGIVVVPLTTNQQEANILRIHVPKGDIPHLEKASDILLDQVHTIDRSLFLKELGPIPTATQEKIKNGIRFLLNL